MLDSDGADADPHRPRFVANEEQRGGRVHDDIQLDRLRRDDPARRPLALDHGDDPVTASIRGRLRQHRVRQVDELLRHRRPKRPQAKRARGRDEARAQEQRGEKPPRHRPLSTSFPLPGHYLTLLSVNHDFTRLDFALPRSPSSR